MELNLLGHNWNRLAETDPMWAILMDPTRKDNRWNAGEFFATGQGDIKYLMEFTHELRIPVRRGRALDFGCGLGRLTQALASYFDEVVGVDIAPAMIRQARACNPYGSRCQFLLNERDDLEQIPDNYIDFAMTLLVLQHMRPDYAKKYVAEFLRILAPGGLLVFQQPSHFVNQAMHGDQVPLGYQWRRKARRAAQRGAARLLTALKLPNRWAAPVLPLHRQLPPNLESQIGLPGELAEPTAARHETGAIRRVDAAHAAPPVTEVHTIPRSEMLAHLRHIGARVLHVQPRNECDPHLASFRYFVTK